MRYRSNFVGDLIGQALRLHGVVKDSRMLDFEADQ